jgi:hypothetical protein
MAHYYAEHGVQTVVIVGQGNQKEPATTAFATSYQNTYNYDAPIRVVTDPNFQQIKSAAQHWDETGPGIPHFVVLDYKMTIRYTNSGLLDALTVIGELTGVPVPDPETLP